MKPQKPKLLDQVRDKVRLLVRDGKGRQDRSTTAVFKKQSNKQRNAPLLTNTSRRILFW
ncbi:MAG: hypothetical protein KDE48_11890 [Anaerolineales bacterium]|nr:hypothetical protein [Anaerolineales bacterium]